MALNEWNAWRKLQWAATPGRWFPVTVFFCFCDRTVEVRDVVISLKLSYCRLFQYLLTRKEKVTIIELCWRARSDVCSDGTANELARRMRSAAERETTKTGMEFGSFRVKLFKYISYGAPRVRCWRILRFFYCLARSEHTSCWWFRFNLPQKLWVQRANKLWWY